MTARQSCGNRAAPLKTAADAVAALAQIDEGRAVLAALLERGASQDRFRYGADG
jgi:hypothetical protein